MTAGESNAVDLNHHALQARLHSAHAALRASLKQRCVETIIRAHIERALAHVREAETALHTLARARTVEELANYLTRIDEMREELQEAAANTTLSLHA